MSKKADPQITRIEPLKPRGLRVRIHLDQGEPFEVMLEALERSRLGSGDTIPANRLHNLIDNDAEIRVRDAALNLLSYRARTNQELRTKLRKKGFKPARIDLCLDRLQEKGFLDDKAVAAAFIRDRLRHRPRGTARLSSELRAKGVVGEVAAEVIQKVFDDEEVTDQMLARQVATAWVSRQNTKVLEALLSDERGAAQQSARRRLYGYLARRGFRGEALGAGINEALEIAR